MQVRKDYTEMTICMTYYLLLIITLILLFPGNGSAIFLHISKPNFDGTEGCIAIEKNNIIELSKKIDLETKLIIKS